VTDRQSDKGIGTGYCPIRTQHGDAVGRSYSARRDSFQAIETAGLTMVDQRQIPIWVDDPTFDRRAEVRTTIDRDALVFFQGQSKVHPCCVRDVTNDGAGLRMTTGFSILPIEFGISFDGFRTMRMCRLIWRGGDFVGVTFESWPMFERTS
jgi:hypothetical protein